MTESKKRVGGAAGNDQILALGRSSRSNASGRFEPVQTEKFDDGWGELEGAFDHLTAAGNGLTMS